MISPVLILLVFLLATNLIMKNVMGFSLPLLWGKAHYFNLSCYVSSILFFFVTDGDVIGKREERLFDTGPLVTEKQCVFAWCSFSCE